ncbi:MAG: type II toxin-antitoxin system VapC family toxin [Gemmatimonadaceae bacterium]|nr:type II toxin-antitoxin system VapC family toxin [Gemmatimonadaceae bacterium]
MVRTPIACLDTHVVAWILNGQTEKLGKGARSLIDTADLILSPAVVLEMQYLHELGRVTTPAADALRTLQRLLPVRVAADSFERIVVTALTESWTRDPFDRLIVAHARLLDAPLVSRDRRIAQAYKKTRW